MKAIKFLITCIFLFFGISVFASTDNTLIIKAHHPNDNKTIVRIWKTPENNYIIRTSYSDKKMILIKRNYHNTRKSRVRWVCQKSNIENIG